MSLVPSLDVISRILFPSPDPSYGVDDFPDELIWVPKSLSPLNARPEDCIPCLFLLSPSARFFIIYLHSNAEDLGHCYHFCTVLRNQFQVHVLAVEYPGYGICPGGQADEASVTENAFTAFRFVRQVLCWPLDGILLLGRSIGTGPALSIAVEHQVYGVILVCPFLSVQELSRSVIGPLAYLIQDRFPNKDRMPFLRSALLVVHGKKDVTVPVSHGELLYRVCKSRKRLVCPAEMEHNTNLHTDVSYFVLPMLQFFALPDYSFDELRIPEWAFDKRLCAHYRPAPGAGLPASRQTTPMRSPRTSGQTESTSTPRSHSAVGPAVPRVGLTFSDTGPWEVVKHMELKHRLETEPRRDSALSGSSSLNRGQVLPGDKGPESPGSDASFDDRERAEREGAGLASQALSGGECTITLGADLIDCDSGSASKGEPSLESDESGEEALELPVPAHEGKVTKVPGTHECLPSSNPRRGLGTAIAWDSSFSS